MRWILGLLLLPSLLGAYPKVASFSEIEDFLLKSGPETLVIFDIDGVLMSPTEPAFQIPTLYEHKNCFKKIKSELSHEAYYVMLNLMLLSTDVAVVDPRITKVLSKLHTRGIKTIALTASACGPLGECPSMGQRRVNQLASLGISFPSHCEEICFKTMSGTLGHYAEYQGGVLFAAQHSKGKVLQAFLKHAKLSPQRVIFIDDHEHQLQDVEKAFHGEFHGFHFIGATLHPPSSISLEAFEAAWRKLASQACHILASDS